MFVCMGGCISICACVFMCRYPYVCVLSGCISICACVKVCERVLCVEYESIGVDV